MRSNILLLSMVLLLAFSGCAKNDTSLEGTILFPFCSSKNNCGFLDGEGAVIVEPVYSSVKPFVNGFAWVKLNDKWGFIDKDGNRVIEPKYDKYTKNFKDGVSFVGDDDKVFLIDDEGNVLSKRYDMTWGFHKDFPLAPVGIRINENSNKWGYIDKSGREVVGLKYDGTSLVASEGLTSVLPVGGWERGDWGAINASGEMVIEPQYRSLGPFVEGLAAVSEGQQYGFINKKNDLVIPMEYGKDRYGGHLKFSNGLAGVKKNNKYGFIDTAGNTVIDFKFEAAEDFERGYAAVKLDGKYGIIDTEGKFIVPPDYEFVSTYGDGPFALRIGDYEGAAKRDGTIIIDPIFDDIGFYFNGFASAKLGDCNAIVDENGTYVIPLIPMPLSMSYTKGFWTVHFSGQSWPLKLDGTPLGFDLDQVIDTQKIKCPERPANEKVYWDNNYEVKGAEGYALYLEELPDGPYASFAQLKISDAAYQAAIEDATINSLTDFINKHPNSDKVVEAYLKLDEVVWDEVSKENSVELYQEYLKKLEYGRFREEASKKIDSLETLRFEQIVLSGKKSEYKAYLEAYPEGKYADEARRKLNPSPIRGKKVLYDDVYATGISVSPDEKHFAILYKEQEGDSLKTLELWQSDSMQKVRELNWPSRNGTPEIAFSSTAGLYAITASPGNIQIRRLIDDKLISNIHVPSMKYVYMYFIENDKKLIVANQKNKEIWSVSRGQKIGNLPVSEGYVQFSNDKSIYTVSESFGKSMSAWSLARQSKIEDIVPSKRLQNVVFSPDGRFLLTGDGDDKLALRDGKTGKKINSFAVSGLGLISDKAFSHDGNYLALGTNHKFEVYRTDNLERVFRFNRPNRRYLDSIAISGSGKYFIGTNLVEGSIWIWDTHSGELLDTKRAKAPLELEYLHDSDKLIVASYENVVVWDFAK